MSRDTKHSQIIQVRFTLQGYNREPCLTLSHWYKSGVTPSHFIIYQCNRVGTWSEILPGSQWECFHRPQWIQLFPLLNISCLGQALVVIMWLYDASHWNKRGPRCYHSTSSKQVKIIKVLAALSDRELMDSRRAEQQFITSKPNPVCLCL